VRLKETSALLPISSGCLSPNPRVYELEKVRCHLCGKVFTAAAPEGAGEKKYDESAAAMMAVLRYGSGFPWNRLEGLEENLGIPLPAATQSQIMAETMVPLQPALDELMRQAARGEVAHNDDTFDARFVAGPACGSFPGADRGVHQRDRMGRPGSAALRCISPAANTPARIWRRC
jgi:Transposase IS66 family